MFIKNFGQFWRAEEVDWFPGQGNRNSFRLLGRQGTNLPGVRLADFRYMQGIYILYANHGPYYTGLTTEQGLGKRLQDHLSDQHCDKWDRFSWFGFQQVLKRTDKFNICQLRDLSGAATIGEPATVIRDVEALLIRAMGLTNITQTQFSKGEEWFQVYDHEVDHYLDKLQNK
jgi:hypothetical protein